VSFSLRTALTFTAVSAICVTAAGCGGGGSSSSALAGLSAKQVLSKAVSDLKSASSFHMAGTVSQGGSIRVDLTYSRGTGCKGTLGIGSKGSVSLLVIGGTAWLKPDHAYWTSYAGSSASSVIALIGGKYLKAATSNSNVSGLAQLCNANSLASSFTSPKDIVKGGTLHDQRPAGARAEGPGQVVRDVRHRYHHPQILRVTSIRSGSSGRIDFTGYGNAVTLTPPPASETINGAKYGF